MAELGQGVRALWKASFISRFMPFRGVREFFEQRGARGKVKAVTRDARRLQIDLGKGDISAFIRDHGIGLEDGVTAAHIFLELIKNIALDVMQIKRELKRMLEQDERLRGQNVPANVVKQLEAAIVAAQQEINTTLRTESDELGALSSRR